MHYESEDIYVAESTAIVAAAGVARMHILLRDKGIISGEEFERARIFALRDLEVFFGNGVPTLPVHSKLEARRAMLEAYWTPQDETTQEPVRKT